jgi:hypothetical protein
MSPHDATPPQSHGFSCGSYFLGFFLAMIAGVFFDLLAWSVAPRGANVTSGIAFGVAIGFVPGVVLLAMGFANRRSGFGLGVMTAACLVLLLGGACGAFFGSWEGGLYGHSRLK